jgi:alkylation response protein AidB-like acyl-CoA dehydrogenase
MNRAAVSNATRGPRHPSVSALEAALGDPFADGLISFANAVALDEREAFPEVECEALNALSLQHYYVPAELGGKLSSFDELTQLIRAVARRDLTVAIAHGKSFLGAAPVWVGGSEKQKQWLADLLLAGHPVALALTERAHGTDLLSIATAAIASEEGYRISGEKWLINNATRARVLLVLARTSDVGGPRSGSLFLVDKLELPAGFCAPLPKIKTHGIRGADISGVRLVAAPISQMRRVGREGYGLEITLRGLLVTRSLISALSLGAADTALRLVLAFAEERPLRERCVIELDHPKEVLTHAFAELLACEAISRVAARALHCLPRQVSLFSAVAKFLIPTTVDALIARVAVVLGARHYLREEYAHGVFQKLMRDAALVSLFDGSTVVNLSALGLQLPRMAEHREQTQASPECVEALRSLCQLSAPLPPFDAEQLSLSCHGRSTVLEALPWVEQQLAELAHPKSGVDPEILQLLTASLAALRSALRREGPALTELLSSGRAGADSAALFQLAEQHAALFGAALCIELWLLNRHEGDGFFAKGEWLVVSLARLLHRAGSVMPVPLAVTAAVLQQLRQLSRDNASLSLFPLPYGGVGKREEDAS